MISLLLKKKPSVIILLIFHKLQPVVVDQLLKSKKSSVCFLVKKLKKRTDDWEVIPVQKNPHRKSLKKQLLRENKLYKPDVPRRLPKTKKSIKDSCDKKRRLKPFRRDQQGKHWSCPRIWWKQCLNVPSITLNNFGKILFFHSTEEHKLGIDFPFDAGLFSFYNHSCMMNVATHLQTITFTFLNNVLEKITKINPKVICYLYLYATYASLLSNSLDIEVFRKLFFKNGTQLPITMLICSEMLKTTTVWNFDCQADLLLKKLTKTFKSMVDWVKHWWNVQKPFYLVLTDVIF